MKKLDKYLKSLREQYGLSFRMFMSLAFMTMLIWTSGQIDTREPDLAYSERAKFIVNGLLVIGLFYSMLGFEFNVRKTRMDVRSAKSLTTFTAISAWHNAPLIDYSKQVKLFDRSNNYRLLLGDIKQFIVFFEHEDQAELYKSVHGIFNYFETLGIAVDMGIMHEEFVRKFFRNAFLKYYNEWLPYIVNMRSGAPSLWVNFTSLAERWKT